MSDEPAVVSLLQRPEAVAEINEQLDAPALEQWHGATPLRLACRRQTKDDVDIARLLLDAGAAVNEVECSPLLEACYCGSAALVSLLLQRGAHFRVSPSGRDAFWYACRNGVHGPAILELLGAVCGAAPSALALESALSHSGEMVHALAKVLPAGTTIEAMQLPDTFCFDPLGAMSECIPFGLRPSGTAFAESIDEGITAWAHLRNGAPLVLDGSSKDAFHTLTRVSDTKLWIWASREPLMRQHPLTGDTLFHLVVSPKTALSLDGRFAVLRDLKRHYRNPLLLNRRGQSALDVCADAALRSDLLVYCSWRPDASVTEWFGPFFQARCMAFLLVCHRLAHPAFSRDIRHIVIFFLAAAECVHVAASPPLRHVGSEK
jgi:hypothetical protein